MLCQWSCHDNKMAISGYKRPFPLGTLSETGQRFVRISTIICQPVTMNWQGNRNRPKSTERILIHVDTSNQRTSEYVK